MDVTAAHKEDGRLLSLRLRLLHLMLRKVKQYLGNGKNGFLKGIVGLHLPFQLLKGMYPPITHHIRI